MSRRQWDLDDRSTWVRSFVTTEREQVRRAMQQARRMYDEHRDEDGEPMTHEAVVRHFNRIKRYWDRVK